VVDGDGVSKVFGNRGGVDSEQDVEAKTLARQGPREFPAATGTRGWSYWPGRGKMETTTRGGSELGFLYQEIQKTEVLTVAKQ
jgi:hypothetical protein